MQSTKANILCYIKASCFTLFEDKTFIKKLHLAFSVNYLTILEIYLTIYNSKLHFC